MMPHDQAGGGAAVAPKQLAGRTVNVFVDVVLPFPSAVAVMDQLEAAAAGGVHTTWLDVEDSTGGASVPPVADQRNAIGLASSAATSMLSVTESEPPTLDAD